MRPARLDQGGEGVQELGHGLHGLAVGGFGRGQGVGFRAEGIGLAPGLAALKTAPISLKASVSEAAAKTLRVIASASAAGSVASTTVASATGAASVGATVSPPAAWQPASSNINNPIPAINRHILFPLLAVIIIFLHPCLSSLVTSHSSFVVRSS